MKTVIKSYDVFSPKINLYFNGNTRYFSVIGLIMTFVFFLLSLGFGIYFLIQFINGTYISILKSKDFKAKSTGGDFSKKVFLYAVKDSEGKTVSPRIIQAFPTYWEGAEGKEQFEHLVKNKCSNTITKKAQIDSESDFTCLEREDNKNFTLYSKNKSFGYLRIYFTKCQNTETNDECLPSDEIDELIEKNDYYIHFYTETILINHEESYPIFSQIVSEKLPIYPENVYEYNYQMKELEYESDEGIFIKQKKSFNDFGLDIKKREQYVYRNQEDFLFKDLLVSTKFEMNPFYIEKYKRSYQKLQSLAADIGGICSLFYFIATFITNIFSHGRIISDINDAVTEEKTKHSLSLSQLKENLCHKNLPKNNFFKLKPKTKSIFNKQYMNNISTGLGQKSKESFGFFEVLFYRCWHDREKCRYLRECEHDIKKYLDIKNIIFFWKELEGPKLDTMIIQKHDLFSMSNVELLGNKNRKFSFPSKGSHEITFEKLSGVNG